MSPVHVGQFVQEAGELMLSVATPTVQEFEEKPELAIGVLVFAIWKRCFEITRSAEVEKTPDELLKFLWDWVYRGQPLTKEAVLELALRQDNEWDRDLALVRISKKGRPIKSRHTAIKALFRKTYLNKSWTEVTLCLCQCGESHDDQLRLKKCQENLESAVRHLKTELKKHNISFFPAELKKSQPVHQARDLSQSKAPRPAEDSHTRGIIWRT
jgi:hypothetical protein